MQWQQVRELHPDTWLIVEALAAHSEGARRYLDRLAVVDRCGDGGTAFRRYRELHREHPDRELYFLHTSRAELDITERSWTGVRRDHAAHPPR